jgi:pyruvate kinase
MTPHLTTYNRLAIYWGVEPIKVPAVRSTDAMLRQANRILLEKGFSRPGDVLVISSGVPIGQPGGTNMLKLHRIH